MRNLETFGQPVAVTEKKHSEWKGPSVGQLNWLLWIPNRRSYVCQTSAEPHLDAILGSMWDLALRKCLFWGWLNCRTNLGKWVDLTAQIGGRNTWTSLRHCLGTCQLKRAWLITKLIWWHKRDSSIRVKWGAWGIFPGMCFPESKAKWFLFFFKATTGWAAWSFVPLFVSFFPPILYMLRGVGEIYISPSAWQWGQVRRDVGCGVDGAFSQYSLTECHLCVVFGLLTQRLMLCVQFPEHTLLCAVLPEQRAHCLVNSWKPRQKYCTSNWLGRYV